MTTPSLSQNFAAQTHVTFNFDFQTDGPITLNRFWMLNLKASNNADVFDIDLDFGGAGHAYFRIADTDGPADLLEIRGNRWYHVTTDVNVTTGIWSGAIFSNKFLDATDPADHAEWAGRHTLVAAADIAQVNWHDIEATNGENGIFYLDNFSIKNVPEPGVPALLGIAAMLAASRRRR